MCRSISYITTKEEPLLAIYSMNQKAVKSSKQKNKSGQSCRKYQFIAVYIKKKKKKKKKSSLKALPNLHDNEHVKNSLY